MVLGDDVLIKVTNFPVPKGTVHLGMRIAGESMWVKIIKGTELNGQGTLENIPIFCEEVAYGDIVRYESGTSVKKPRYVSADAGGQGDDAAEAAAAPQDGDDEGASLPPILSCRYDFLWYVYLTYDSC